MSEDLTIVARRIVREMLKMQTTARPEFLPLYMGLGLALCYIYEITTGRSVKKTKTTPREVIEWAKNLPDPRAKVIIVED